MAGCDGWIVIKIFELIFATFCMIYKRVTDDEANKLFYFLQKFSREWPLLNNITWEENGAIFTDITYGGYIIIIIGLIIGQCSGELQRCRKMENFFLILGALLFIAAGSLELASLESVEERLVDNAAILGVFSLVTGFLFIIDWLSSSKRRKKEKLRLIEKFMQSRLTQTEENKSSELLKTDYLYGNIQNGKAYSVTDLPNGNRILKNAVKLLPSTPVISNGSFTPLASSNDYTSNILYSEEPSVIDRNEVKTHEGRVKSTESFLRSEKGYYPKFRKPSEQDRSNNNFFIPDGYVLVPANQLQEQSKPKSDSGIGESQTPPVYTKIISNNKAKAGYVVIPIDQKDGSKKLQSLSEVDSPQFYYLEREGEKSRSPKLSESVSMMNSSDLSDVEEPKFIGNIKRDMKSPHFNKLPLEYLEIDSKGRRYILQSEDSSDEQKLSHPSELHFRPESRHSFKSLKGSKEWHYYPNGKVNEAYAGYKETDLSYFSRKSSPFRSRTSSPEKPRSILRYEYGRSSGKENEPYFSKDGRYDSLDSQKISEDLKNLREITKSDLDLNENLEKENIILKERLREEKKKKEKLKCELEDRKKLGNSEEEKNRRVSEREEQYFGIKDLRKSFKKNLETPQKMKHLVKAAGQGAENVNEKLKEKHLESESKAAREEQEFRNLIDERFYFLNEEGKEKKRKETSSPLIEPTTKPRISEAQSTSDLAVHSKSLKSQKSYSDEMNSSQSTDEEIKIRVGTPGSASYKSEALFWLGTDKESQDKSNTPTSPGSPGYVLYTAQNWPDSPSPEDRFQFSAKEAQQLSLATPPKTPVLERVKPDFSRVDEKKNSQKLRLLEFEEVPENAEKSSSPRKGLLVRKVDFLKDPVIEIKRPAVVQGSTSTWKKWLYPRPKLQHTRFEHHNTAIGACTIIFEWHQRGATGTYPLVFAWHQSGATGTYPIVFAWHKCEATGRHSVNTQI